MRENKDGFIFYYNEFKDKIFHYFLYRVGLDRSLAEDLTSEVFIKALKNFEAFDASKRFQPWIYAIAHNHLVNHYRLAGRFVPLGAIEETRESSLEVSGQQVEIRYELGRALRAIDAMPNEEREVLRLKFVDGLGNREIAEVVGKEEGAVRTQISRSLHKLRGILNEG